MLAKAIQIIATKTKKEQSYAILGVPASCNGGSMLIDYPLPRRPNS
jgi:hypothetical protein